MAGYGCEQGAAKLPHAEPLPPITTAASPQARAKPPAYPTNHSLFVSLPSRPSFFTLLADLLPNSVATLYFTQFPLSG